ncbi:MAG: DarT ssDNA thymidine ADP-ribosyltransferase family protein [Dehalococcoidia bacterium]
MARMKNLYYITHMDNVPSILKQGILSHERVVAEEIPFTRIYNEEIVANRREIRLPDGRTLWSFANIYFQPRNAMLFKVKSDMGNEKFTNNIAILAVRRDVLDRDDIFVSTGNAAHSASIILPATEGRKFIPQIRKDTDKDYWNDEDGSKRKMMAECLVPDTVAPEYIQGIYVASHDAVDKMRAMVPQLKVNVVPEPKMFFQPLKEIRLTPYLTVIEGDMFFSKMQTLTVSVNCVGVMGKGLASRAKYQFPRVYVFYQDLCRKRKLQMGKPYLYKLESSIDYQLADEPSTLSNAESETWFLMFPTKQHWRDRADVNGIEKGLQWLRDNYEKEGIKSLAVPALGCGLGKLDWRDVGPLLCRYLKNLQIPAQIYLPAETKVPDELLSPDFLLGT